MWYHIEKKKLKSEIPVLKPKRRRNRTIIVNCLILATILEYKKKTHL